MIDEVYNIDVFDISTICLYFEIYILKAYYSYMHVLFLQGKDHNK